MMSQSTASDTPSLQIFQQFLSTSKSLLSNLHQTISSQLANSTSPSTTCANFFFLIGNESCDLDTLISSFVLSYVLSRFFTNASLSLSKINSPTKLLSNYSYYQHLKSLNLPENVDCLTPNKLNFPVFIPVLQISSKALSLRPEFVLVLNCLGLTLDDLITLDHVQFLSDLSEPKSASTSPSSITKLKYATSFIKVILLDQNKPPPTLCSVLAKSVVGCIDHHVDENFVTPSLVSQIGSVNVGSQTITIFSPDIIKVCGSCTSLVIDWSISQRLWSSRYTSEITDALKNSSSTSKCAQYDVAFFYDVGIEALLAKFTLASIVSDTGNLKSLSKTTELDLKIANILKKRIKLWNNFQDPARKQDYGLSEDSDMVLANLNVFFSTRLCDYKKKNWFANIQTAIQSVSGLSLRQLLSRDYKCWQVQQGTIGIASIPISMNEIFHQNLRVGLKNQSSMTENSLNIFLRILADTSQSKHLDLLAIMTSYRDFDDQDNLPLTASHVISENPSKCIRRRELLLVSYSHLGKDTIGVFETLADDFLKLDKRLLPGQDKDKENKNVKTCANDFFEIRFWCQNNVDASRKAVAPELRKSMSEVQKSVNST